MEAFLNIPLRSVSFTDTLWYKAKLLNFILLPSADYQDFRIIERRVTEILLYVGDPSKARAYLNLRLVT